MDPAGRLGVEKEQARRSGHRSPRRPQLLSCRDYIFIFFFFFFLAISATPFCACRHLQQLRHSGIASERRVLLLRPEGLSWSVELLVIMKDMWVKEVERYR